jgi:hypothetical protein
MKTKVAGWEEKMMSNEQQVRIGAEIAITLHSERRALRNASSTTENVRVLLWGENWSQFEAYSSLNCLDFVERITFPQREHLAHFTMTNR